MCFKMNTEILFKYEILPEPVLKLKGRSVKKFRLLNTADLMDTAYI